MLSKKPQQAGVIAELRVANDNDKNHRNGAGDRKIEDEVFVPPSSKNAIILTKEEVEKREQEKVNSTK